MWGMDSRRSPGEWIDRLTPELDAFGRWRSQLFLGVDSAVRSRGESRHRCLFAFHSAQEISEAAGASVVQVMTIHKAKGLTFDITIVPDLEVSA